MLGAPKEPHSVQESKGSSGHKLLVLSDVRAAVGQRLGKPHPKHLSLQSVTTLRGDSHAGSDLRSASLSTCQGGPKKL